MLKKVLSDFNQKKSEKIQLMFPIGHFYSPIANPAELRAHETTLWAKNDNMPGIDMHIPAQLELLRNLKPHIPSINYPKEQSDDPAMYFYSNDQYPMLDAEFLFTFLCLNKPKNMIEIGSGFSSLITADVNRRVLGHRLNFTCIEPYPRQFLIDGVDGITQLVREKVENVEVSFFDRLDDGDILFIDSSHVSKIGSDVNYLFFEVLPSLKKGVIVHFHDIFLPDEYPKTWAIEQGRNWNEQYMLRAFMQYNVAWRVVWASYFMGEQYPQEVRDTFPRFPNGKGGSFWIIRDSSSCAKNS